MRSLLRLIVLTLLIVLIAMQIAPLPAHAQQAVTIDTLTVRIWPEFDRPLALVFLIGATADASTPPGLRFTLPPDVTINAVAYSDSAAGGLFSIPYTRDGTSISLNSPNGTFWIEFYDPALTISGNRRSYALNMPVPYAINTLTYEVQSPPGARDLSVEPSAGGVFNTDQYGLPVFSVMQTGINAGDTLSVSFTYTRTDSTLTVDTLPGQGASQPAAEAASAVNSPPSDSSLLTLLVIGLIVLGVLLIGGGAYWYARRPAHRTGGGRLYCTRCGRPVQPGDRFCRNCGSRLLRG